MKGMPGNKSIFFGLVIPPTQERDGPQWAPYQAGIGTLSIPDTDWPLQRNLLGEYWVCARFIQFWPCLKCIMTLVSFRLSVAASAGDLVWGDPALTQTRCWLACQIIYSLGCTPWTYGALPIPPFLNLCIRIQNSQKGPMYSLPHSGVNAYQCVQLGFPVWQDIAIVWQASFSAPC